MSERATHRLAALDVLRGVAIFGTFGTNVWLFADPGGPAAVLTAGFGQGGVVETALLLALPEPPPGAAAEVPTSWPGQVQVRLDGFLVCRAAIVLIVPSATVLFLVGRRSPLRRRSPAGAGGLRVPEQWPHVRAILTRAGDIEVVLLAEVDRLPVRSDPPMPGLTTRCTVGVNGVRISAWLGAEVLGHVEVDTDLAGGGRLGHLTGWADIGNLHVVREHRRRGVATWVVGEAADWLRLARVDRLLDHAGPDEPDRLGLAGRLGFRELTRTARSWSMDPPVS